MYTAAAAARGLRRQGSLASHRLPNSAFNNANVSRSKPYKTWFKLAVTAGMLPVTVSIFSAKALVAYKRYKALSPNNQVRALFGKRAIRGGGA